MKFSAALSSPQPLLVCPSRLRAHCDTATAAAAVVAREDQPRALGYFFGARPAPSRVGSVAVLPVRGVIGAGLSDFDADTGGFDLDDLGEWLDEAEADAAVSAVFMDFDTPGGTVSGVAEAAERIRSFSKPVVAFVGASCCSAGYWLASAAHRVLATPSAQVGSIGVYIALPDYSALYEANGIRVDVIKAGELKAAGVPGTALSDAQREDLQNRVNAIHAEFKAAVSARRSLASADSMRGQSFSGREAAARGLVTGLVSSRREALAHASR